MRSAIASVVGAKVRLKATIGGKSFWQLREIQTGCGQNQNPLEADFGLVMLPTWTLAASNGRQGLFKHLNTDQRRSAADVHRDGEPGLQRTGASPRRDQ